MSGPVPDPPFYHAGMTSSVRRFHWLAATLVSVLAASACTSDPGPAEAESESGSPSAAVDTVEPTPTPSPTEPTRAPTPSPAETAETTPAAPTTPADPATSEPPYPADGTQVDACNDLACEVAVSEGVTVPAGSGEPTFTVQGITAEEVRFLVAYPAGNQATLSLEPGDFAPFGDFRITLYETDGASAVVSISTPSL